MKKAVVTAALLIFLLGVALALFAQETRIGEEVLDEWNPIHPSTLYPHRNETANEFNATYCAFIERAKANNKNFESLLKSGTIKELFLEVNISASSPVRVRVGILNYTYDPYSYDYSSVKADLINVTFDEKGALITKRVKINLDGTIANADFLEIKNEGAKTIEISGNIKLVGMLPKTFYPFLGLGTFICLSGFLLMGYGFWAKPKRKLSKQIVKAAHLLKRLLPFSPQELMHEHAPFSYI